MFAFRTLANTTLRRSVAASSQSTAFRRVIPAVAVRRYSAGPVTEIDERNHVTGIEKLEVLSNMAGKGLWDDNYLSGPFGTREKPVVVPSVSDTRIVGCVGDSGDGGHDLMWHEITKDKPLICAECGQVFVLQKFDIEKKVEEEVLEPLRSQGKA